MDLDIRLPLGLLFLAIGALLVFAGLTISPADLQRSQGLNVDLIWGAAMAAFGGAVTALAALARRR
jgi:hypothetical protein